MASIKLTIEFEDLSNDELDTQSAAVYGFLNGKVEQPPPGTCMSCEEVDRELDEVSGEG